MRVALFTVVLEVVRSSAVIGSTEDVVEADDAADAERIAIERWRALRPGCSFQALVTAQHA